MPCMQGKFDSADSAEYRTRNGDFLTLDLPAHSVKALKRDD